MSTKSRPHLQVQYFTHSSGVGNTFNGFFRDEAGLPLYLHLFTVMRLSHFAIFVAILCLVSGEASAIQEMRPPFGMTWGESQKNVEKILLGTKVKIVGLKTLQGRTAIEVEGIRQQHLLKALFYFDSDALSEIELQYGCAEWDSARSNDFGMVPKTILIANTGTVVLLPTRRLARTISSNP